MPLSLVLPYSVQSGEKKLLQRAVFLPKTLKISGFINTESRGRGIFEVSVLSLALAIEGEFDRPRIEELKIDPAAVDWSQAHFAIGISDVRALRAQSRLLWNGSQIEFLPGTSGFRETGQGLHAGVTVAPGDSTFKFSFPLSINGSESVYTAPFVVGRFYRSLRHPGGNHVHHARRELVLGQSRPRRLHSSVIILPALLPG